MLAAHSQLAVRDSDRKKGEMVREKERETEKDRENWS